MTTKMTQIGKKLHLDIETYSEVDIAKCGNYRYAMDPSFRILLIAYAWDDEPTQIIDMENLDEASNAELAKIYQALYDPSVLKVAHNATFERVCFTVDLRRRNICPPSKWLDARQWKCTMVQASRCGLPASLKQIGEVLALEDQKMSEGKALIQLFCTPHEPRTNGLFAQGKRALPADFPEKWETFKAYCVRDVDVERAIEEITSWYEVSDFEKELYGIDQEINDRGVLVDTQMAAEAVKMNATVKARLNREAIVLTGLSNPNSVAQLKQWIGEQLGVELSTLRKSDVSDMANTTDNENVKRVLQIRAEMGKTSCAKYEAMLNVAGEDGRCRGLTQFHGARTGRWAGRLIQMQNLPQNHLDPDELGFAREMLRTGSLQTLELCFGNVPDTMSQLIRTAFIAPEGYTFAVCDFSAIEARVLAWMAGEQWVLDVFRNGGDIYCETASQMFHVPVEKHGRNAGLRQKGKISVLALGYGGAVGALDAMGGQRMGMTEQEEKETVAMWRAANPHIVAFWTEVEKAARECALYGCTRQVNSLLFRRYDDTMTIQLPSGRLISYPKMTNTTNRFGGESLKFMGLNQETKAWGWIETHGGKLTENIIQAVARDCLAETMTAMAKEGYKIVFHVHDELICEVKADKADQELARIQEIFSRNASWNEGLPLKGAGYCTPYYLKD